MITPASQGGLFDPALRIGAISSITAASARVNLHRAGVPGGTLHKGARYGLGEVGEFVLVESELAAILARIIEVRLPESERSVVDNPAGGGVTVDAVAQIQLLGTIALDGLAVTAGISVHPRLGDRVFSAPAVLLAAVPLLMERNSGSSPAVSLSIGRVSASTGAEVHVTPERLFSRHCAILGATGGGKSYTVSRFIEECIRYKSKVVLIDATGEYRGFSEHTSHVHLGRPSDELAASKKCSLPPSSFTEADFNALFQPAGKTQGPKLRAAIRSLRLVAARPALEQPEKPGVLVRANRRKQEILRVEQEEAISRLLNNPTTPFDAFRLADQIVEECVYETPFARGNPDGSQWGGYNEGDLSYCTTLLTRINGVLTSPALECVFGKDQGPSIADQISSFLTSDKRLLRISLEGIQYEFAAREIVANALGRFLLGKARAGDFRKLPVLLMVDEAHNFLGRKIGDEDAHLKLDSFEGIAKEGRKYGLNLCLATQRPRDITYEVLSQMGTLIVHRLTNDQDREVVERACGEIDKSASAFLPNLEPGEAAIVGVDFPIPLTIQVTAPSTPPKSNGANFQKHWSAGQ
ncbi:MAG: ATP-binding protein [Planctomycetes bacterium]|nr:ATP-binding protein [Planctomycetota bacterium]